MSVMQDFENRIKQLESKISELNQSSNSVISDTTRSKFKFVQQNETLFGLHFALCVDTIDPYKQNRVRYYSPRISDPETPLLQLPFARPISAMGGFDDSGLNWVPPGGSTIALMFASGDRGAPFYLGTTWQTKREGFGIPMKEFEKWYAPHRGGYLIGDPNQVKPPWNTESYNGHDIDSKAQFKAFLADSEAQKKITYPNIYGFKTPEKHMLKMVDGNVRCQRRHKRIEILSGCGQWMCFKDDNLHYSGQESHPSCNPDPGGADISTCSISDDGLPFFTDPGGDRITAIEGGGTKPTETLPCLNDKTHPTVIGGHPSTPYNPPDPGTKYKNSNSGTNPFFKHANECRPFRGAGTPQNNRADLPQSGWQVLSRSGHTMVFDDSVEEPRGFPKWDDPYQGSEAPFDFGCNDKYLGVSYWRSATGHQIALSDVEEETKLRGNQNYIRLRSATGNKIELNDHTVRASSSATPDPNTDCPPNMAGDRRGIFMQSTSNHVIWMSDNENKQCGPVRAEGGNPTPRATKAFVLLKTGYGLSMRFGDDNDQVETQQQDITITNPQCHCNDTATVTPCLQDFDPNCNKKYGPHILSFRAAPQPQPGLVWLRVGGNYVINTSDSMMTTVGDKENNPSTKMTIVSKDYIVEVEKVYFNHADKHVFFAEDRIFLMAGRDCPPKPDEPGDPPDLCKECGPCVYPVIIARCPLKCPLTGIIHWSVQSVSERVFASGNHPCMPSTGCPGGGGCGEYFARMAAGVKERGGCKEKELRDAEIAAAEKGKGIEEKNKKA
jgi:hypothetical protein